MPTTDERLDALEQQVQRINTRSRRTRERLRDLIGQLSALANNGLIQGKSTFGAIVNRDNSDGND